MTSPGIPTTRLTNAFGPLPGVAREHERRLAGPPAYDGPSPSAPHWRSGSSAPGGGMKTVMSPSLGSAPMWWEKRSTSSRWPTTSVGSIDSDGMTYGFTANAWIAIAKNSAVATMTTSSAIERRRPVVTSRA